MFKLTVDMKSARRAVGAKQSSRAVREGAAARAFISRDADPAITEPFQALCEQNAVPVELVGSSRELGAACGIAVGAAVAVILR